MLSSRGSELGVVCSKQRIRFNKAATLKLTTERVLLLWDKAENRFGVQCTASFSGSLLSRTPTASQSHVACKAFLQATGLEDTAGEEILWDDEQKILSWSRGLKG